MDATAARPLARCPITRRLVAGYLSRLLTPHRRDLYLRLNQYGLVRAGLEAAPRRHQLLIDAAAPLDGDAAAPSSPRAAAPATSAGSTAAHTDASHTDAALDISNAHTAVARAAVYAVLLAESHHTDNPYDKLELLYFLSVYSAPNATYIQVGASFHAYVQTDALQQGEADASHAFGHVLARLIADHLAPTIPTIAVTLIHDDTTFAGIPYLPPDSLTPSDPPP